MNVPGGKTKVEDIRLASSEKYEGSDEFLYNISGGKIYISFVNTEPLELIAGEPFMYIRLRTADNFATGAELKPAGNLSMIEFATADGSVVEGINISMPVIKNYGSENNFVLGNCIPNPMNSTAEISYILPESGHVRLAIFNVIGEEVKVLIDENQAAGSHKIVFSGNDLQAGIFTYRMDYNSKDKHGSATKKMIIIHE
jgi:hypothetical protein